MIKILLLTHGKFAEGLLDTLTLFFGEDHGVKAISAYTVVSNPREMLRDSVSSLKEDDQLIVCTDILGGSVNQLTLEFMNDERIFVITGFNFPLILELLCLPKQERVDINVLSKLTTKSREGMILLNSYQMEDLGELDE